MLASVGLPGVSCESLEALPALKLTNSFNHGQTCCAGSRIFVQRGIYKEFTEKFAEYAKQIKVGDPFAKDTFQGAQVSQTQYDRIMNYVECGKAEGAKIISGGERHGTTGYFIQPTIFMDVQDNMTIAKEEVFGPLVCVTPFDEEEEAIKMANDTVYGMLCKQAPVEHKLTFRSR
jgi:aldehyde dehydrogenase (NAD+)